MISVRRHSQSRAFTLIELLTVMAITAILLTIIVVPVIQSFNLVRLAQAYSEAQERARIISDKIAREIGQSAGVRDNSGALGAIDVITPSGPGSTDATVAVRLPFAKLDIVKPAEGEPQVDASGNTIYIDPSTGKVDPTLRAPKGQVVLPVGPGSTIVRYFIALRDPFAGAAVANGAGVYNNPYDGLLMARQGGRDNLFVLYRAEVQPFLFSNGKYVPNTQFFATDVNGNIILDDPDFMIPDGTLAKAQRIQSWLSQSVVQTEVSRYDMVLPVFDKTTRQVKYDFNAASGDYSPELIPLIQFRPTRISDEPATAMDALRLGEESDTSLSAGSDVYRTRFGDWTSAVVHIWPYSLGQSAQTGNQLIGLTQARSDGSTGFSIYSSTDGQTSATEMFDVATYESGVGATPYPFTNGIEAAQTRSGWLGNPTLVSDFLPFFSDPSAGKLYTSFAIPEVGVNPLPPTLIDPQGKRPNLPLISEGTMNTPLTSNGAGAVYGGAGYTINDAFDLAWAQHPEVRQILKRFIDLRVTPNEDGTFGPLWPTGANMPAGNGVVVSGGTSGFPRATIVPGSEVVYGPDALPGPNYGQEIRYTRITQGDPGPNQYKMNYGPLQQPVDYTILGLTAGDLTGFQPGIYDPGNFVSAEIQSQFEPGFIQLDSDPATPLPNTTPFKVYYRFQFTQPTDAIAVDYDSRQAISILLTIRNYPQSSSSPNPQVVTLKTTADVKNFLRS